MVGLLAVFFISLIVCYGKACLKINGTASNAEGSLQEIEFTRYTPPTLKSLIVHPESQDNYFDFILDTQEEVIEDEERLEPLAKELIDYFFLGITLPSEDLWVNLNSVQESQVTSPRLALTDIGKVLLEADLTLKRDCSRFTDPRTKTGKEYWDKLQARLNEEGLNTTQLPIGNRFWIIPEEAAVEEDPDNHTVTIVKSKLKVCLEQEYLKLTPNNHIIASSSPLSSKQLLTQQICDFTMKQTILPHIQERVNYAQEYSKLRQVYNSLILAEYYKQKYHNGQGLYPQLINRAHLEGLESTEPWNTQDFYDAYVNSAQEGEYRFSQQEYDPFLASMVKKYYFYGGVLFGEGLTQRLKIGAKKLSAKVSSLPASIKLYIEAWTRKKAWSPRLAMREVSDPKITVSLKTPRWRAASVRLPGSEDDRPARGNGNAATPEAAKAFIDSLSADDGAVRTAAADALDSMGIHSATLTDAIDRGHIETEVTDDGFLKVHVYNAEGELVKTYTFESYIDHFEGSDIAFMDSTEHDAMYRWINKKTDSGDWDKNYTVINFDFHSDDDMEEYPDTYNRGNWAGCIMEDNLAGRYWWVHPVVALPKKSPFAARQTDSNHMLSELPESDDPVIITIDLDYIIPKDLAISDEIIDKRIEGIVNFLTSKGYDIKGINISRSRRTIHKDYENQAVRKLKAALEEISGMGSTKMDMRLSNIEYQEGQTTGAFEYDGNAIYRIAMLTSAFLSDRRGLIYTHKINQPFAKLALAELNPAVRISACLALKDAGTPKATQDLLAHLKTETDPEVIKAVSHRGESKEAIPPSGIKEVVLNGEKASADDVRKQMERSRQECGKNANKVCFNAKIIDDILEIAIEPRYIGDDTKEHKQITYPPSVSEGVLCGLYESNYLSLWFIYEPRDLTPDRKWEYYKGYIRLARFFVENNIVSNASKTRIEILCIRKDEEIFEPTEVLSKAETIEAFTRMPFTKQEYVEHIIRTKDSRASQKHINRAFEIAKEKGLTTKSEIIAAYRRVQTESHRAGGFAGLRWSRKRKSDKLLWRGIPVNKIKSLLYPASGDDYQAVIGMLRQFPNIIDVHLVDICDGGWFNVDDIMSAFNKGLQTQFDCSLVSHSDNMGYGSSQFAFMVLPSAKDQNYFWLTLRHNKTKREIVIHLHKYDYFALDKIPNLPAGADLVLVRYPGTGGELTKKKPLNFAFYSKVYIHTRSGGYIYIREARSPQERAMQDKLEIVDCSQGKRQWRDLVDTTDSFWRDENDYLVCKKVDQPRSQPESAGPDGPQDGNYVISEDADWSRAFEDNTKPIRVEVGFGDGTKLVKMALAHPENNYIGIDAQDYAIADLNAMLQSQKKPITNLKLIHSFDWKAFPQQTNREIVSEIYYIALDQKQLSTALCKRRRFRAMIKVLEPGGKVYISTQQPLYPVTLELFDKANFKDVTRESKFPHGSDAYQEHMEHCYVFQKPYDGKKDKGSVVAPGLGKPGGIDLREIELK